MSTYPTDRPAVAAIADVFFSIFGPVSIATVVMLLALALGIL